MMGITRFLSRLRGQRTTGTFAALVVGEVVSFFGSNLTSFVLGVWVFQATGSATQFSFIAFFSILPEILLAPIAGTLVDRWNRRSALLLSDAGAAVGTLLLAVFLWTDLLQVWHIFIVVILTSAFESFQAPAFQAAIPQLVPRKHLVRANGLASMSQSGAALLAPLAAGAFLDTIGLKGVLVLDLATFSFAVAVLLVIRIPDVRRSEAGSRTTKGGFAEEFLLGWRFLRPHRGFLALMAFFAVTNFYLAMVGVLLTPLVLGFTSATALGTIVSVGAGGVLAGSLVITAWGSPRRKVRSICLFFLGQGAVLFLGGLQPSLPLIAGATFTFSFFTPMLSACAQALWQSKVPEDLQGRIYAVRRIVAYSAMPLSYLLAGPLVDFVFEPLMSLEGPLASSVGRWIGTGSGRGVGLLFISLGLAVFAVVVVAYSYRPLRCLEDEIPDLPEAPPDQPDTPS